MPLLFLSGSDQKGMGGYCMLKGSLVNNLVMEQIFEKLMAEKKC